MSSELSASIRLALPLAAQQIGFQMMGTVDAALLGRYSDSALAGAGVGNNLLFAITALGLGIVMGLDSVVPQAIGAGRRDDARRLRDGGVRLAILVGLALTLAVIASPLVLDAASVDPDVAHEARVYVIARSIGVVPFLVCVALRSYLAALDVTRPLLFAVIAGNLLNAALDVALIYGVRTLGIPPLGVIGAACATSAVQLMQLGVYLYALRSVDADQPPHVPATEPHPHSATLPAGGEPRPATEPHPHSATLTAGGEPRPATEPHPHSATLPAGGEPRPATEPHPHSATLPAGGEPRPATEPHPHSATLTAGGEPRPSTEPHPHSATLPAGGEPRPSTRADLVAIARYGVPVGLQLFAEVGIFGVATVLAAHLGKLPAAAHSIALNLSSFTFAVAVGVGSATTVRVGHAIGAGEPQLARRRGALGLGVGLAVMAGFALIFVALPGALAGVFSTDPAVIAATVPLLQIAALFQLSDGTQAIAAGALRGVGDTRATFVANVLGHYAIGLPISLALAFGVGLGAPGLWWGLSAGLTATALALVVRFVAKTREPSRA